MKHRGYKIVKVKHPTPFNPYRETYDILAGDAVRRANISTIETAKMVIDAMIKWGYWQDRSATK